MQCMEAKQKLKKGRRSNCVNKEGCDNGEGGKTRRLGSVEGRVGNEKWKKKRGGEDYGNIVKYTYNCSKNIIENSANIIMIGDFNCKEVCWEEWYAEGEESWGGILLDFVVNTIMIQWIKENTRFRGNEESSRLDLLLTKELEVIKKVNY